MSFSLSFAKRTALFATFFTASGLCALGCSSDEEPSSPDYISETGSFESDLSDRMLSSLTDEEIVLACEDLAEKTALADAMIACQIEAAASTDDATACRSSRDSCLESPGSALEQTTVRSTPAPIDCSLFAASLTAGCEFPMSKLEECANALIKSVVPAAAEVSCEDAGAYATVAEANAAASVAQSTDFIAVCAPLLECEDLVSVLLTGMLPSGESGLGGAGGSTP